MQARKVGTIDGKQYQRLETILRDKAAKERERILKQINKD